jgi:hypothetical protein
MILNKKNKKSKATTSSSGIRPEHRKILVEALRAYSASLVLPAGLPAPMAHHLLCALGLVRANARLQYARFLGDLCILLEEPRLPRPDVFVGRKAIVQLLALWQSDPAYLVGLRQLAQSLPYTIRNAPFWEGLLLRRDSVSTYKRALAGLHELPDSKAFIRALRRCCTEGAFEHILADGRWRTLHRIWQQIPNLFDKPGMVRQAHLQRQGKPAIAIVETLAGDVVLPAVFRVLFDDLNDLEIAWCCHLLSGGSISTLPDLWFTISPEAAALVTMDPTRSSYGKEGRVATLLFECVLLARGMNPTIAASGAPLILDLSRRSVDHWLQCCEILHRMDAPYLVPRILKMRSDPGPLSQFLSDLEHCCTAEVFRGVFQEQRQNWVHDIWRADRELFRRATTKAIVNEHGCTYGLIELLMGKHILPEPFLLELQHKLGRQAGLYGMFARSKPPLTVLETGWMVHMLQGGGIRYAPGLPFKLSKATPHTFNTLFKETLAPSRVDHQTGILFHLIFSELIVCGARSFFAEEAARLSSEGACGPWVNACRYLIRMDYPTSHLQEVYDFIRMNIVDGEGPSLKSMTQKSLGRRIEQWHIQLAENRMNMSTKRFPEMGFEPYITELDGSIYRIDQIRRPGDLFLEGRELRHCVAGYAKDIRQGRTAIFSMRRSGVTTSRLITIQVTKGCVIQAKGIFNREPNPQEVQLIRAWARLNLGKITDLSSALR